MNCQSAFARGPTPREPGSVPGKATLENQAPSGEDATHALGERAATLHSLHQPVHRRPPGALAYPERAPPGHPLDQLGTEPGREDPTLRRREPGSGEPLNLGERTPES